MLEIHRSPVFSTHKGPVMQSFDVFFDVALKKNCWTNIQVVGDLRGHDAHVTSLLCIYEKFKAHIRICMIVVLVL